MCEFCGGDRRQRERELTILSGCCHHTKLCMPKTEDLLLFEVFLLYETNVSENKLCDDVCSYSVTVVKNKLYESTATIAALLLR